MTIRSKRALDKMREDFIKDAEDKWRDFVNDLKTKDDLEDLSPDDEEVLRRTSKNVDINYIQFD